MRDAFQWIAILGLALMLVGIAVAVSKYDGAIQGEIKRNKAKGAENPED